MVREMLLGGMWHSYGTYMPSAPCHIPANLFQSPALPDILKKNPKSNQIRAHPKIRMEVAPCGLDDVGCAALPHTLARQQVWPQPSLGGCSNILCLSFPFPSPEHFTF